MSDSWVHVLTTCASMHIWLLALVLTCCEKVGGAALAHISYVVGLPLEPDQIFEVNNRHREERHSLLRCQALRLLVFLPLRFFFFFFFG